MPEHPIDGTDGSAWPTVKASDGEHGGPNMRGSKGDLPLPSAAAMWPTPDGQVIEGDTAWKERREREKAKGRNGNGFGLTIAMAASLWPTPDTTNVGDGTPYETLQANPLARRERTRVAVQEGRVKAGSGRSENLAMAVQAPMWMTQNTMDSLAAKSQEALDHEYTHRKGRSNPNNLRDQVVVNAGERTWPTPVMWRTPSAQEPGVTPERLEGGLGHRNYDKKTGRLAQVGLTQQVQLENWPTPTAHDGRRPGSDATSTQGANLKREGESWATPTTRDHKDGANPSALAPTNGLLGRQAPRTAMLGPESSQSDQTSPPQSAKRLNPRFVEWLMGFPTGWTDLQPLETPSSGDKPDSHGMS